MNYKQGFRQHLQTKRAKIEESTKKDDSSVVKESETENRDQAIVTQFQADFVAVDPFNPPADGRKFDVPFNQTFQDPVPDSLSESKPEKEEKEEEVIEEEVTLSSDDILAVKTIAYSDLKQKDLSMNELLNFVLYSTKKKKLSDQLKESLFIREMIDMDGKITKTGKIYLELDETKQRLIKYLNEHR